MNHAGVTATEAQNVKCELDYDEGNVHYDVEFDANGYEYDYEIDDVNGNVLKSEKEKDDDVPASQKPAAKPTADAESLIGKEKAKQIALDHAGVNASDAKAVECELDRENGKAVYEVEFDSGEYEYSYEINGSNGKVISHEKERKD